MTQFSSRPPVPDTLAQRSKESWFGTQPVTLTRGDQQINGSRMGISGGIMVHRPERDVDFGPDRGFRVWNQGMFAELSDIEWEEMGWTATVRQTNPTNLVLADLRDYWKHRGPKLTAYHAMAYLDICNVREMDVPQDHIDHALEVLARLAKFAPEETAA